MGAAEESGKAIMTNQPTDSTSAQLSLQAIAAVSTLTVAFIAGGFSLLGLIISKEQKISDFRQSWIDALRDDIALYVSKVTIIKSYVEIRREQATAEKPFEPAKHLEETRDDYDDLNQASFRIKLRLNPAEADSRAILELMTSIEKKLNAESIAIASASSEISVALSQLGRVHTNRRASTMRANCRKARKTRSSFSKREKMRRKPLSLRKSRSISLRFL